MRTWACNSNWCLVCFRASIWDCSARSSPSCVSIARSLPSSRSISCCTSSTSSLTSVSCSPSSSTSAVCCRSRAACASHDRKMFKPAQLSTRPWESSYILNWCVSFVLFLGTGSMHVFINHDGTMLKCKIGLTFSSFYWILSDHTGCLRLLSDRALALSSNQIVSGQRDR